MTKPIYHSGQLELDAATGRVTLSGEVIDLPRLSYLFLTTLIEKPGECVEFDELIDKVWRGEGVSHDTITQRASLVRKALSKDEPIDTPSPKSFTRQSMLEEEHEYFEAVRGIGYRWLMPVTTIDSSIQADHSDKSSEDHVDNVVPLQHPSARPIEDTEKYSFRGNDSITIDRTPLSKRTLFDRDKLFNNRKKLATTTILLFFPALLLVTILMPENSGETKVETPEVKAPNVLEILKATIESADQYVEQQTTEANSKAIELYLKALRMDNSNVGAIRGISLALLQKVDKFNGTTPQLHLAERYTRTLLLIDEQAGHNLWLRGYYFEVVGNYIDAISFYEKALAKDFRPKVVNEAIDRVKGLGDKG